MPIRACLFDFDGTLADSMWVWEGIGRRFLSDRGLPPDEGLTGYLALGGLRAGATGLVRRYGLDEDPAAILEGWLAFASRQYATRVELKPGVEDFLRSLRAVGVRASIATAQERGPLLATLERCGAAGLFDAVVVCSDVCDTGKATPAVYLHAAETLGAAPAECAVFEDVAGAAEIARSAGFHVVGVADAGPQQDRRRLMAACDAFVEGFEGLDAGFLSGFGEKLPRMASERMGVQ